MDKYIMLLLLSALYIGVMSIPTNAETYLVGADEMDFSVNEFISDGQDALSMLVPALLIITAIVFFMLDFAVVGVIIGCVVGLTVSVMIGIIALSTMSLVTYIILAIMLIFKVAT